MSVVKINAIEVPDGDGPELERRFGARAGAVENAPGFEEFCLLRPAAGDTRYFVYTRWASEHDYQAWAAGLARTAHARPSGEPTRPPIATGATLLEFEVVTRTVSGHGEDVGKSGGAPG